MTDDARDAEIGIFDQPRRQRLVDREVRANKSRDIVNRTADLPALDQLVDLGEPLLDLACRACLSRMISAKTLTGRDRRAMSTTA